MFLLDPKSLVVVQSLSRVRLFTTTWTAARQAPPSFTIPLTSPLPIDSHICCCCLVTQLCPTPCDPWAAAGQAYLSFTISWSLLKLKSIESVMPSTYFTLCCPLLLLPSIFPRIRVFSSELALCIRWQKYWSFSFSISPSHEYSGFTSFRMD